MKNLFVVAICLICVLDTLAVDADEQRPCIPCEELKNIRLPDVLIHETISVNDSSTTKTHCKVAGTIGKEINFELLLPELWNGRFVMGGGGGFVGYMMNRAAKMVHEGFATVGTDTGHEGTDASWALNNMERQLNFGHLAVHRTAIVAKSLIFYFYCTNPAYSYFIGLSRGGGQAMMEAQRYPTDFDGIVAGAPAFDWVGMGVKFIQDTQIMYPNPNDMSKPVISRDNLKLLEERMLQQCDALDGLADSILTDPRDCDFNLDDISLCPDSVGSPDCFTSMQMHAVKTVYEGVTTQEGYLHPGFPFGGENEKTGWHSSIVGPNRNPKMPTAQAFFGIETFRYLIFNDPEWDYSTYDFKDVFADTRYASAYLDAINPDYSAFKNHGGKMIIYQGWIDPLISALDIIAHYESAEKLDAQLKDYIRLYMLPGVTHIGGKGPSKVDWFQLIQDWVEEGKAPERAVASKIIDDEFIMSRPIFPYPKKATYDGIGDPAIESSFKRK